MSKLFGIIEDTFIPDVNYDGEFSGPKDYETMLTKAIGVPSMIEHKDGTCIGKVTDVQRLPHVKNYLACEITVDQKLPAGKAAWKMIENKRGDTKVGLSFRARALKKDGATDTKVVRHPYHEVVEVSVVDQPRVENAYVFALKEHNRFRVSKSMGLHMAKVSQEQSKVITVKNSLSSEKGYRVHNTNFSKSKESLLTPHNKKMSETAAATTTSSAIPEIDLNTPEWREKILGKLGAKRPTDLDPLADIQDQRVETLKSGFKNLAGVIQETRPDLFNTISGRDIYQEAKDNFPLYDLMFSLVGQKRREQEINVAETQKKKEEKEREVVAQVQKQEHTRKRTFADVFFPEKPQFTDASFATASFANENMTDLSRAVELGMKDGAQTLYREELKKQEKQADTAVAGGATLGSFFQGNNA